MFFTDSCFWGPRRGSFSLPFSPKQDLHATARERGLCQVCLQVNSHQWCSLRVVIFSEGPFAQGTCIPGQYRCAAQRGAQVDAGASGMTGRPRHSERTLGWVMQSCGPNLARCPISLSYGACHLARFAGTRFQIEQYLSHHKHFKTNNVYKP